ncbi:MAG: hypothetical protein NTY19_04305 [Planctomycetota bacterium]|nr:hypothetical protein [Planctomycetota bacterium]
MSIGAPIATRKGAMMTTNREHDFTLVLTGVHELSERVESALFEAGCDDATLSLRLGRIFLTFSREAPSLKNAVISAIGDVRKANIGAGVMRVDSCNLVTQTDIARRIDQTRQSVHQYVTGARGPGNFPPPACEITEGAPLWLWCEVAHWLWENGLISEVLLRDSEEVAAINSVLELQWLRNAAPGMIEDILRSVNFCQKPDCPTCHEPATC